MKAAGFSLFLGLLLFHPHLQAEPIPRYTDTRFHQNVRSLLSKHPGKTGAFVLEKGEEALLARAWLTDQAKTRIDTQYFIWSADNIGILASESLLRAADRGVKVRIIVDDLLIDADDRYLLALALHPLIDIRVYNPKHSVGTSLFKRLINFAVGFRSVNQRMHNKTAIFDNLAGITGGRNMADEYFDFDHEYNFRDRDVLVVGPVVSDMSASFEKYWTSPLVIPVEDLLASKAKELTPEARAKLYSELHAYAENLENYDQGHRLALIELPKRFSAVVDAMSWSSPEFLADIPGKNDAKSGLGGGGAITTSLLKLIGEARRKIVIQSPYLVVSDLGLKALGEARSRNVEVSISTNSLASTDNFPAYAGFLRRRDDLLKLGVKIHEFRPNPAVVRDLVDRRGQQGKKSPIFAVHAKTLVVDDEILYVGTFNLDPRSANLNTEVGMVFRDPKLARSIGERIGIDMRPENSWDTTDPQRSPGLDWIRRARVRLYCLLPIEPIL